MPDTSACGATPASWSAATNASAAAATAASLSSSITLWALTATDIRRRTGPTGSGTGSPRAAARAPPAPRLVLEAHLRSQGIPLCRPGRRRPGVPFLMGAEDKPLHPGIPLGLIRQVVHRLGDQGRRARGGAGIDLGVGGLLGAARREIALGRRLLGDLAPGGRRPRRDGLWRGHDVRLLSAAAGGGEGRRLPPRGHRGGPIPHAVTGVAR